MKNTLAPTFLATLCVSFSTATSPLEAATIVGFNTVTFDNSDAANTVLTDLTYGGSTYAAGDLLYGSTDRYYNLTAGGTAIWPEGDPFPANGTALPGGPKAGDFASKADDNIWTLDGTNQMSSIDGLPYQQTIFSAPTNTVFVFERGGNDTGTIQPIYDGGVLGAAVTLTAGSSYLDTGANIGGQNAFGYVFEDSVPMVGIQINAPGHDALTVAALSIPEPGSLSLLGLGMGGLLLARRRRC